MERILRAEGHAGSDRAQAQQGDERPARRSRHPRPPGGARPRGRAARAPLARISRQVRPRRGRTLGQADPRSRHQRGLSRRRCVTRVDSRRVDRDTRSLLRRLGDSIVGIRLQMGRGIRAGSCRAGLVPAGLRRCNHTRAGGGLAGAARHHGDPVCRWRTDGRARTCAGAAHGRHPRPAGRGGECRRRGRHRGIGARRAGCSRRLSASARQYRHACLQPDALQTSALQCGDRLRAGGAGCGRTVGADHAQRPAGGDAAGIRHLRQSQPRHDAIRVRRRGLGHPHHLRAAQHGDGHRDHARALSRQRAGDTGSHRRPRRFHVRRDLECAATDQGQGGEGDRHARRKPHHRAARSADRRRAGPHPVRRQRLERALLSARDAGDNRQPHERGCKQGTGRARCAHSPGGPRTARTCGGAAHTRIPRALRPERDRQMVRPDQGERRERGLISPQLTAARAG